MNSRAVLSAAIWLCIANEVYCNDGKAQTGTAFTGYGEWMQVADFKGLACAVDSVSSLFTIHMAGINLEYYPEACARCISLACTEPLQCLSSFSNITVAVVDNCPTCNPGDVKLNSFAYTALSGLAPSTTTTSIAWRVTDCAPFGNVTSTTKQQEPEILKPGNLPWKQVVEEDDDDDSRVQAAALVVAAGLLRWQSEVNIAAPAPEVESIVVQPPPAVEGTATVVPVVEEKSSTPSTAPAPTPAVEEQPRIVLFPLQRLEELSKQNEQLRELAPTSEPELQLNNVVNTSSSATANTVVDTTTTTTVYAASSWSISNYTTGKATLLSAATNQGSTTISTNSLSKFACQFGAASPYFLSHYAGVNLQNTGGGDTMCGGCVFVRCEDASVCVGGKEVVVQVVDDCGSCGDGDVTLSADAMSAVTGSAVLATTRIAWQAVPCRQYTEGDVYINVMEGDNEWYTALTVGNTAEVVKSVSINGQQLKREGSGSRFVWQSNDGKALNKSPPMIVKIEGMSGKYIQTSMDELISGYLGAQL